MTWLRKMRPVLIVVGLALAIGSIIGARALTNGNTSDAANKAEHTPRAQGGPIVLGTVDTDPPPVAYGLPPVLQMGTVTQVFVKDGDEITIEMIRADKHALYRFDDTIQQSDLKLARSAVALAETKLNEAKMGVDQHAKQVDELTVAVEVAKKREQMMLSYYYLVETSLEALFKAEKLPERDWPERKKRDPNLYKANADYIAAESERKLKEAGLNRLKAIDPQLQVKEAEAAVEQAKAQQAKAQAAVDLCIVKAKMPGMIEQVTIAPGATMGVGTRTPALWLIPTGARVVRAEVEAEFAHRVGPEIQGKTVTIFDHSDPNLTYSGVVRRIGTSFLLKRGNAESFLGNETRVIEVVVEVTDPTPPKKPPLRVGQRVRVNLGQ